MAPPVLAWGAADPITTDWSGVDGVNVIRTAGVLDPFGGLDAIKLDEQGALDYNVSTVAPISLVSQDGRAYVGFAAKQDTAAKFDVGLYDLTSLIYRGKINPTWNGVNPPTIAVQSGAVALTPLLIGNGWWWFHFYATAIDPTHTFRVFIRPSGNIGADVGATLFYLRKMVFPGDAATAYLSGNVLRSGYGVARAPGKNLTVYRPRRDYSLGFTWGRIPTRTTDSPWATGWDGAAPHVMVEVGVEAFIKAARGKAAITWALDYSDPTRKQNTMWLEEPMRGNISTLEDGTRSPTLKFDGERPFEGV